MEIMFMIYHDENVLDALPRGEMQALIDSALDYDDEIGQSGHYIVRTPWNPRGPPGPSGSAAAWSHDRRPLRRTKEQLGGFFLIEAKDIDEACEVACGSRRPA